MNNNRVMNTIDCTAGKGSEKVLCACMEGNLYIWMKCTTMQVCADVFWHKHRHMLTFTARKAVSMMILRPSNLEIYKNTTYP